MLPQLSRLLKDYMFHLTLTAILVKSVLLVGLMSHPLHTSCDYLHTVRAVLPWACIYVSPLLFLLSFGQILRNRPRLWFLLTLDAAITTVLLADLWYLRGFGTMPSLGILRHTADAFALRDSIASMAKPVDILFIADVVVFLAVILLAGKLYRKRERNVLAFAGMFIVGLGVFLYVPIKVHLLGRSDSRTRLYDIAEPNETAFALSPIGYHLLTVASWLTGGGEVSLSTQDRDEIRTWYERKDEYLPDNKYRGMLKGKNLLLIQVESLETFVIGQKVQGQEITPTLNGLLRNSLYFSNVREQTGEGVTSDAELLANTSVYPIRNAETFFEYPHATYNSLPHLLRQEGYFTHAIQPDAGRFWNWSIALTNIGFQKCTDSVAFERDEVIGLGLSDGSFLRQVVPVIRKQPQPFFVFMITLSSHGPFNLPRQHRDLTLSEELDKSILGGYFQGIHYTDRHLGIFLDALSKDGLLDNTVVVIYGDHEGVHKQYSDHIADLPNVQGWWLENDLRIPLIVFNAVIQAEEIRVIGGQVDILPTLSYLLGVDPDKCRMTAVGRNLLRTKRNFAVVRSGDRELDRYLSDDADEKAKAAALKGVDVSEKIIKGGYLKYRNP